MNPQPSEYYFKKLNLEFTSVCNMACPECSAGTNGKSRKQRHYDWQYFVDAARWLGGFESVVCIGGEPTSSPHFAEYVPKLRELFGCRELILWTNGFKVKEYAEVIKASFDAVYTTLYDAVTAPWNKKPNTEAVEFIKVTFPHLTNELPHTPLVERGSGGICERGIHGPIAYADGKLWGCCVAMALPGAIGVTPGPNWKEELVNTPLPCSECCFSPKVVA